MLSKCVLVTLLLTILVSHNTRSSAFPNNRPVVGIVSMPITDKVLLKEMPELQGRTYISASYVKFIEMAGGRPIIIASHLSDKKLRRRFRTVNALLFPGGESNLEDSKYYTATKKLFQLAIQANKNGTIFPILGICRGMQAMLVHMCESLKPLTRTDSRNYTAKLKWDKEALKGVDIPQTIIRDTETLNITSHFHKYSLTMNTYKRLPCASKMFQVLATSVDRNNVEFVSAYQARNMPFYGIQFHPEKTMFEWAESVNIPHSSEAIRFAQYYANIFMDDVRKNTNIITFPKNTKKERLLLATRKSIYTGNIDSHSPFCEIYAF